MNLEDVQMSNDVLEHCLQHLSSEAAAQAVVTMHADVEWRLLSLEISPYGSEDEGETYANASSESLSTSMKELIRSSKKGIEDSIDFGITAYDHDVTSFAVGDTQLDRLERAALRAQGDSSEDSNAGDLESQGISAADVLGNVACRSIILTKSVPHSKWYQNASHSRAPQTLTSGNNLECLFGTPVKMGSELKISKQIKRPVPGGWPAVIVARAQTNTPTTMSDSLPTNSSRSWQNQYYGDGGYNQIVHDPPRIESINRDSNVHHNPAAGHPSESYDNLGQIDYYGHRDHSTRNDGGQGSGHYLWVSHARHTTRGVTVVLNTLLQIVTISRYTDYRLQIHINPNDLNAQIERGRYAISQLEQPPVASDQYIAASSSHSAHDVHRSLPQDGQGYHGHPPYHVAEAQQAPNSHTGHAGYDSHPQVDNMTHYSNLRPECGHYYPQLEQQEVVQSLPSDSLEHHDRSRFPAADGDQPVAGSSHSEFRPYPEAQWQVTADSRYSDLNLESMRQPPSSKERPPSDKIANKLYKGIRNIDSKLKKRASKQSVYVGDVFIPSGPSPSMGHVLSHMTPISLTGKTIEDVKVTASKAMITAVFQETLFPSADELTKIALTAMDTAIAEYSGETHAGLTQWKLRSEGRQHISRMKGELKQVYVDFQNVAEMSMLSAYGLALDLSKSKLEMMNLHTASIRYLLLNFYFADVLEHGASTDNELILIPFGHTAIRNSLEYIVSVKQYSRYLLLGQNGWETHLKHAIAFTATVGYWALEKSLAGWSATLEFATSASKLWLRLVLSSQPRKFRKINSYTNTPSPEFPWDEDMMVHVQPHRAPGFPVSGSGEDPDAALLDKVSETQGGHAVTMNVKQASPTGPAPAVKRICREKTGTEWEMVLDVVKFGHASRLITRRWTPHFQHANSMAKISKRSKSNRGWWWEHFVEHPGYTVKDPASTVSGKAKVMCARLYEQRIAHEQAIDEQQVHASQRDAPRDEVASSDLLPQAVTGMINKESFADVPRMRGMQRM
ncbi:hypothetical protein DFH29DRAFT_883161 [Suillus ampliporus]|nr:hypothetical protein DFH29DRAFT_883161 [Suillus ampliporus]